MGGAQIHDFNPGITQSGLFWTTVAPADSVQVNLNAGTATLELDLEHMKDFFNLENALVGGGARPNPAIVSFKVQWTSVGPAIQFDNAAQSFRGTFRNAMAQMEWTARSGDFEFESAPLATSTTDAAELGQESNGSFY